MVTCKLCSRDGELRDSHVIPRWTYHRALGEDGKSVTVREEGAAYTSSHFREHMLCDECEGLFQKDETVVSRLAYQRDGSLPLGRHLNPLEAFGGDLAGITGIEAAALARFAASVFWRCHVAEQGKVQSLCLRRRHADIIREFLRGRRPFPDWMAMNLVVLLPNEDLAELGSLSGAPATAEESDDRRHAVHELLIAGLLFRLTIGRGVAKYKPLCLTGTTPTALLMPWTHPGYMRKVSAMIGRASPKGSFARRPPSSPKGQKSRCLTDE
jgi:hypothetical protein